MKTEGVVNKFQSRLSLEHSEQAQASRADKGPDYFRRYTSRNTGSFWGTDYDDPEFKQDQVEKLSNVETLELIMD